MPQVPVYGDRQVRTEALRPVLQQTPDVSSGARALAQGLGQAAEVADRIDLRDAQAKASTAEATITSDWLKWDSANRSKYRGANADGYAPAAEAWWKSAAENAGKDLDPRAKLLASQNLRVKQTAAMGNVLTFTGAEKERHADETYEADQATTIQFGITSGDVASTAVQIRNKAAVLGDRKGWTTEQVQAEAGKKLSAMHLAQISKLTEMPNGAALADAYYKANKAEVAFQNQARVEQVIDAELDNQFAKAEALRVSALPFEQQKAELIKITDPKRLEKTQIELNNLSAIDRRVREQTQDAARDQVYQRFEQNQPIPEALLSAMGGPERSQFENLRLARSKREAKGESVKTDFNTWYELQNKVSRGERVDLRAYTERISTGDLKDLAKMQQTAVKPGEQEGYFTKQQRVEGAFQDLTGKPSKDDPAAAYTFQKAVDARMLADSLAKNRKLSVQEEEAAIISVAKDSVYVKGFWGSAQMPVALVPKADQADAYVVVPLVDANGQQKMGRNNVPLTKRQPLAEIPTWFRTRAIKSGAKSEQEIAEDYTAAKAKGLVK